MTTGLLNKGICFVKFTCVSNDLVLACDKQGTRFTYIPGGEPDRNAIIGTIMLTLDGLELVKGLFVTTYVVDEHDLTRGLLVSPFESCV
jgi:hypothetical protein